MAAIALTIAGSDSGGGAGIQADLKAFSAHCAYGASVITAITAQNTCSVDAIYPLPCKLVEQQIDTVLSDLDVRAIKIGMLGGADVIATVATALKHYTGPIVLDPVMIAKSGDALLPPDAVSALRDMLVPRASLLTPNIPEAAALLGQDAAYTADALHEQALALRALGAQAVLMKGGHGQEPVCTDWLITDQAPMQLDTQRLDTQNTHGTGCSYSSAITALLANGLELHAAVKHANRWLHNAIRGADILNVGRGHGPIHHFHALWPERPAHG